ncbi:hypothetical protein C8Q78DRAFT_176272 [Trametes maxima]|nr:hypothetical protein C8Q78DRAFT_176272 [Trametes maxima]
MLTRGLPTAREGVHKLCAKTDTPPDAPTPTRGRRIRLPHADSTASQVPPRTGPATLASTRPQRGYLRSPGSTGRSAKLHELAGAQVQLRRQIAASLATNLPPAVGRGSDRVQASRWTGVQYQGAEMIVLPALPPTLSTLPLTGILIPEESEHAVPRTLGGRFFLEQRPRTFSPHSASPQLRLEMTSARRHDRCTRDTLRPRAD